MVAHVERLKSMPDRKQKQRTRPGVAGSVREVGGGRERASRSVRWSGLERTLRLTVTALQVLELVRQLVLAR